MFKALMWLGSGLIGALTYVAGIGWITLDTHTFNAPGAFINILAVVIWVCFVIILEKIYKAKR